MVGETSGEDRFQHPYPVGLRVRSYGEQYVKAIIHGTAVIIAVKPSGRDFEYRVRRDEPLMPGGDCEVWWASYRTYPADKAYFSSREG